MITLCEPLAGRLMADMARGLGVDCAGGGVLLAGGMIGGVTGGGWGGGMETLERTGDGTDDGGPNDGRG